MLPDKKAYIYIALIALIVLSFLIRPSKKKQIWREQENPRYYVIHACLLTIFIMLIGLLNS